jgi:hypothetical protein
MYILRLHAAASCPASGCVPWPIEPRASPAKAADRLSASFRGHLRRPGHRESVGVKADHGEHLWRAENGSRLNVQYGSIAIEDAARLPRCITSHPFASSTSPTPRPFAGSSRHFQSPFPSFLCRACRRSPGISCRPCQAQAHYPVPFKHFDSQHQQHITTPSFHRPAPAACYSILAASSVFPSLPACRLRHAQARFMIVHSA